MTDELFGFGMAALKPEGMRIEYDQHGPRHLFACAVADQGGRQQFTKVWITAYNGFLDWLDDELGRSRELGIKFAQERRRLRCAAKRGRHSEKPEYLHRVLPRMYGHLGPMLELFAREDREGWDCYGDEISSTVLELPQTGRRIQFSQVNDPTNWNPHVDKPASLLDKLQPS